MHLNCFTILRITNRFFKNTFLYCYKYPFKQPHNTESFSRELVISLFEVESHILKIRVGSDLSEQYVNTILENILPFRGQNNLGNPLNRFARACEVKYSRPRSFAISTKLSLDGHSASRPGQGLVRALLELRAEQTREFGEQILSKKGGKYADCSPQMEDFIVNTTSAKELFAFCNICRLNQAVFQARGLQSQSGKC